MSKTIDTRQLVEWFSSPLGRICLGRQRQLVEKSIERCFGVHQLEYLIDPQLPVAENSLLGHRIVALPEWQPSAGESLLVSDSTELALEADSVDLVVLHHTLDLSQDPHQTVREASRVLRSGGHLVIIGFNPYSLWGALRWLRRGQAPWNLRFLSASRVEDWLGLLEFQVRPASLSMIGPPINNQNWLRRFRFLERWVRWLGLPIGAFYVTVAQKRVAGRILKPRWKKSRLVGVANVRPLTSFEPHKKSE